MRELKHLQTFEAFNPELIDEGFGDFARGIGKKLGVLELTDEELEQKANRILQNENKILDAIRRSTNPELHLKNYNNLKKSGNRKGFYEFIIFLNDNIDELIGGEPLYYKVSDFGGVEDTRRTTYNTGVGGRTWNQ
jgi:hypothetical protein